MTAVEAHLLWLKFSVAARSVVLHCIRAAVAAAGSQRLQARQILCRLLATVYIVIVPESPGLAEAAARVPLLCCTCVLHAWCHRLHARHVGTCYAWQQSMPYACALLMSKHGAVGCFLPCILRGPQQHCIGCLVASWYPAIVSGHARSRGFLQLSDT
jgi:hypothetical protein